MSIDMVNKRNSKTWVRMNDNSKSHIHRDKFVAEHGGKFVKNGRYWEWKSIHNNVNEDLKPLYEFKDESGVTYLVDNLMKFCRQHELNKSAIYKVMNGERKHHKGFTCKKVYQS
jgi:hypothetical protein